jgi:hypothetical protein
MLKQLYSLYVFSKQSIEAEAKTNNTFFIKTGWPKKHHAK